MRILFVAPYVPSPVRIRPYAFIRELARRGHELTLACLVQPASERQYLADVSRYCRAIHPVRLNHPEAHRNALFSLPTRTPLSVAYCSSRRMRAQVGQLVGSGGFDVVHTEFVRAAPWTAGLNGYPKVYDAVDSLALASQRAMRAPGVPPLRRLVAAFEWLKMRDYERAVLPRFDRVLASSPADGRVLAEGDGCDVVVIPNGIDAEAFAFDEGPREARTIIFLGRMSYYVNVASLLWFYREVFPLVRRRVPGVRLKIIGRDPVRRISALTADGAVEVTGTVSDVRPHLGGATLSICPMVTGAGIQNKMLEAMAVGTPTVATSIACQALAVERDRELLVADEADDFAEAVLRLLGDEDLRRDLAHNARRYVEQHHDWWEIGHRLEMIYTELVG